MARSTYGANNNHDVPSGQENYDVAVLFDEHSTSTTSHIVPVDTNFVRLAAFNLGVGETLTIEQITGYGAGNYTSDYAPVDTVIKLYYTAEDDQRTTYTLERPGRYRLRLDGGGLGTVRCFAIPFYMENESNQDLVDALLSVIQNLKRNFTAGPGINITFNPVTNTYTISNTGVITASATVTTTPHIIANNLTEDVNVSPDAGNQLTIHGNGLYVGGSGGATPCGMGALVPSGQNAVNNYVNKNGGSSCLQDSQLLSSAVGNIATLHTDGIFVPGGGVPTPCNLGASIPLGTPVYFLGIDSSGCVVKFSFNATTGIISTTTTNTVTITNECFPCSGSPVLHAQVCATLAPSDLSVDCTTPGLVTLTETTRFQVGTVTGGTGPYTYDWSHVTYSDAWSSGTGVITPTIAGHQLTLTDVNSTFDPTTGPGTYQLTINPGSYVLVTDSLSDTLTLYIQSLPAAGSCSSISSGGGAGQIYNNNVNCSTPPCTPDTATIVENASWAATGPVTGANSITNTYEVSDLTPSTCCSGFFALSGTVTVQITDPLNTMGEGNPYTAPITSSSLEPSILNPGGGPDTDWPVGAVFTDGEVSWVQQDSCTGTNGHGPQSGGGSDMTLNAVYDYSIPDALFHDGVAHTVTITISSVGILAQLGNYEGSAPCCFNEFTAATADQVITQTFGP